MTVFSTLCGIYKRRGYEIVSGIDPLFSNHHATEYTWIFKDGRPLTHHLGISSKEVYLLESLFERLSPLHIFGVGNSFGWSTLALSLLNPMARTLVLEMGADDFTREWITHTNKIAHEEGLPVNVVRGRSPDDVSSVVAREFSEPIDTVFIDGDHSPEQLVADFNAILPHCHEGTIYIFHDIINFGLSEYLAGLSRAHSLNMQILYGTSAGMGILYGSKQASDVFDCCSNFGAGESVWTLIHYFHSRTYSTSEESLNAVLECVRELGRS